MQILRDTKILYRLWFTVALALVGIGLSVMLVLSDLEASLWGGKEEKNLHIIETAHSVFKRFYALEQNGTLTREQAQREALETIRVMRYGNGKEYFWVNDMHPYVVMHAAKPQLEGKDVSGFKDPENNYLYNEFVKIVKTKGEGKYAYLWDKLGDGVLVRKLAYVKGFEPWGYIIGTGVYVDDVSAQYASVAWQSWLTALVLIAIISGAIVLIVRSIVGPVNDISNAMEEIANGDGNLKVQLATHGNDELSCLSHNFNTFVAQICDTVSNVSTSIGQLSNSASSLDNISQKSQNHVLQQRDLISQVAASINQLNYALQEVAKNSENANQVVHGVEDNSQQGSAMVQSTVSSIHELSSEIQNTVEVISTLAEQTDSIGGVLDVIRSIADQTNLLALNAAIEAARAGEHGRGFAVVADEVRTLASRTQESTAEINDMIEKLQSNAQQAVTAIGQSHARSESTVENAEKTGEALTVISQSVGQLLDINSQVASSTTEQSSAVDEINGNVAEINHLGEQSAKLAEDTVVAGQEVGSIGQTLQQQIHKFKC